MTVLTINMCNGLTVSYTDTSKRYNLIFSYVDEHYVIANGYDFNEKGKFTVIAFTFQFPRYKSINLLTILTVIKNLF